YFKILAAGGSEAPEKILSEAGINIRDPKFWQGGFDVLEKLVSELEKLPVEKAKSKTKKVAVKAKKATTPKKAAPAKKSAKKK
ncbi:MAG: hypothetical protein IT311_00095, partial [Anaerolineales bacterium]|nr:hypothetical protein [Anaerolineales bacterium]